MSDERPSLFSPSSGERGMTDLHAAAHAGDRDSLVRALAAGTDVNARDEYRGYTAVHWLADMAAAGGPRVDMLRMLVEHGADLNAQTLDGDTALMLACRSGSYGGNELVPALLLFGANPRVRTPASTALHEGVWDSELVKHLIAAGASLDDRDGVGRTALEAARARLLAYADEGGRGMEEVVAILEAASHK